MTHSFLDTPIGVVCLLIVGGTALVNIYAHWIEDGLVGRLLYMALALTALAGLLNFQDSTMPVHIMHTIIVLFAALCIRNTAFRTVKFLRFKRHANLKYGEVVHVKRK